jgi:predicted nucleic acid-binding protein
MEVAVDSSMLVALLNPRDLWRGQAVALHQALLTANVELFYFDCVVAEAISTAVRRLHEKGRVADVNELFDRLSAQVPNDTVTWVLPDVPRLYPDILDLMRTSGGALNFNDALIALACRERGIPAIASFDADFDQVNWLHRLARPEDVTSWSP